MHSPRQSTSSGPRSLGLSAVWIAPLILCLQTAHADPRTLPIEHSAMVGDGIAVFIPDDGRPGIEPSLALEHEPTETGPLVADWSIVPEFSVDESTNTVRVNVPEGSDLYGTGEVLDPLRRNGQAIEVWNTDNFSYEKAEGKRLYQSHPWVLGVRPDGSAFGLLFDSTWKARLETNDEHVVFSTSGPACRVIIVDRSSPQKVLSALADLTGHMPMPPRWALGFQQCRFSYHPDSRVREIAREFRARRLPCDVIWMDIDYMDGFRIFTFDAKQFPDPAATNAFLHENGFKGVWMIDPGVKAEPGYRIYDSGTKADAWVQAADRKTFVGAVWPGDCVFPDFTMPETRAWWSGLYRDFMATGIDGVWNDMNEPAVFETSTGWTMPEDNWHRGGGGLPADSHLRYHNVYGMLMVRASREGMLAANPDRRPFILTRSNHLGGHRYAATWTGDNSARWIDLKRSVPMSINLGLSGQPFSGPDIGGFTREADPVLFGHWIALGAFYPFSRAHNDNVAFDKEPWAFGPAIERVAQTALFRRYRLLPYLYTQMESAARTGVPVMQPAFFADPADTSLRKEQEAFLVGPDLLVVPLWSRRAAIPAGHWRPVTLLEGDREDDAYQPILRIRDGAIVPLGEVVQNTTEESLAPLTLLVSLDDAGEAEGTLYEDAGDGFGYANGDFARSVYRATREGDQVIVRLTHREGRRNVPSRRAVVRLVTEDGEHVAYGDLSDGVAIALRPDVVAAPASLKP